MWEDNHGQLYTDNLIYNNVRFIFECYHEKKTPIGMKKHCKGRNFCCFLIVFLSVFVQANSIFPESLTVHYHTN